MQNRVLVLVASFWTSVTFAAETPAHLEKRFDTARAQDLDATSALLHALADAGDFAFDRETCAALHTRFAAQEAGMCDLFFAGVSRLSKSGTTMKIQRQQAGVAAVTGVRPKLHFHYKSEVQFRIYRASPSGGYMPVDGLEVRMHFVQGLQFSRDSNGEKTPLRQIELIALNDGQRLLRPEIGNFWTYHSECFNLDWLYEEKQLASANSSGTSTSAESGGLAGGLDGTSDRESSVDLGDLSLRLARIPAGEFLMGRAVGEGAMDEEIHHQVRIGKDFFMGVTEVTQEQYVAVMNANPSKWKGNAQHPVESISWQQATEFCKRLSERTGRTVRLPTEAEWEYACNGGQNTRFHFGDDLTWIGDYEWCYENSKSRTHPVAGKRPNRFGLFDMHGNVSEWCAGRGYDGAPGDENKVTRGGSWLDYAYDCRSVGRSSNGREKTFWCGFRVVVEIDN